MGEGGGSAPIQPGGGEFHRPKRAWLRTGRADQFPRTRTHAPPSDRLSDHHGVLNRKRQGAQAGSVLILLIEGRQWVVRLCNKDEPKHAAEGDTVVAVDGKLAQALRGRTPGEEVWLMTAAGLPRPYGRRVQARVLEVVSAPSSSLNARGAL